MKQLFAPPPQGELRILFHQLSIFRNKAQKQVAFLIIMLSILSKVDAQNCTTTPNYTIPAGQTVKISTLFPTQPGGGPTSTSLKIFKLETGATLEIDKSFTFSSCTFRGGSGSKITTSGAGTNFRANFSNFIGCGNIWQGIIVTPSTRIGLEFCTLQDFEVGITFPGGYNAFDNVLVRNTFSSSAFMNNNACITIGSTTVPASVGFSRCWANTLQGTPRGIIINKNSNLNFGTSGGNRNLIRNVNFGIDGNIGSSLSIVNTTFNKPTQALTSVGIQMSNPVNVFVDAPTPQSNCLFTNCGNAGISVINPVGVASVKGATFLGRQDFGIQIQSQNSPGLIDIQSNTFVHNSDSAISSIFIKRPPNAAGQNAQILYNNITGRQGIQASCRLQSFIDVRGTNGALADFEIRQNTITNEASCVYVDQEPFTTLNNGILVSGPGDNVKTILNPVNYTGQPNLDVEYSNFGIAYINMPGIGHEIRGNTVTAVLLEDASAPEAEEKNKSTIQCGIHVTYVKDPNICLNTMENTHRGFHLGGNMPGCTLSQNTMLRHVHGLYCEGNGITPTDIGDQVQRFNLWQPDPANYISGGVAAKYRDFDINFMVPFEFYVHPSLPWHMPPNADPTLSEWFVPDFQDPQLCWPHPPQQDPIRPRDVEVASGIFLTSNDAGRWDQRRALWTKLLRQPGIETSNASVNAFYSSTMGSSAQRYAQASLLLDDALATPPNLSQSWTAAQNQAKTLRTQIMGLDSLIGLDTLNINLTYLQQKEQKLQTLDSLRAVLESLFQTYEQARQMKLLQLASIAGQLPATTLYENAWKTMLTSAIQEQQGAPLTQAQRAVLIDIAESCPEDLGAAVTAVTAYMPREDSAPYMGRESFPACDRSNGEKRGQTFQLQLRPNPASEQLIVDLPLNGTGDWTLFSLTGQKMLEGAIDQEQQSLMVPLNNVAPGLYIFVVKRQGETLTSRFSVVK